MLTAAPLESARFGMRAFRATLQQIDVAKLFDELVDEGVDLAILRVPSREAHAIRSLAHYGLDPIHADTLVSYECDLRKHAPTFPATRGFSIDIAKDSDRAAIADLVTRVFTGYPTHYLANPLLDREAVVQGYLQWALSHLHGEGLTAWVARKDGRVASIACSAFDASTGICQGVLHGVDPDFARCGIYTALIRHTQQHFREQGFSRLGIQTQAWNMPVQRVWVREGFTLTDVFETFHVNALFDPRRSTQHALRGTPDLQRDIREQMSAAMLAGNHDAADDRPCLHAFRIALFRNVEHNEACMLQTRVYEFRTNPWHIMSGTLFDAAGQPCAVAFLSSREGP